MIIGPKFYVGIHMPAHAFRFERCMISVNCLRARRSRMEINEWMMDSGAFTELSKYGAYRHSVDEYAKEIRRWKDCGRLLTAVAQDYMCEPFILAKTGLTVPKHQQLTIERYDALLRENTGVYVLPVLQGYEPHEYAAHLQAYGRRLRYGAWVGVGSICKRNTNAGTIEGVLRAIKKLRPDLRLHGFGIKTAALRSPAVRSLLYSADSMAWSYNERVKERELFRKGIVRDYPSRANDWQAAAAFVASIEQLYS
jgi:hypothetical protein